MDYLLNLQAGQPLDHHSNTSKQFESSHLPGSAPTGKHLLFLSTVTVRQRQLFVRVKVKAQLDKSQKDYSRSVSY